MKSNLSASVTVFMILALIAISSCGNNQHTTGKTEGDNKETNVPGDNNIQGDIKKTGNNPEYTILNTPEKMEWIFGKDYKPWKPSETVAEDAFSLINKCFDDQKRGTANRLLGRKPEDYCMQFIGAVNSSGEKILWVNCFCKKEIGIFKDWKDRVVFVADGGNCFFNVKFNLDKDEPYVLIVNGNA